MLFYYKESHKMKYLKKEARLTPPPAELGETGQWMFFCLPESSGKGRNRTDLKVADFT